MTDIIDAFRLLNYVNDNYGQEGEWDSTRFLLQEALRVQEARTFPLHGDVAYTGKPAMDSIAQSVELFRKHDAEFASLIDAELKAAQGKENVRAHVKKIWTWPLTGYLSWKACADGMAQKVCEGLGESLMGRLALNKGRVFLELGNVTGAVWNICPLTEAIESFVLERNIEECSHVTVVNSNVVANQCGGVDKVDAFIKSLGNEGIVTVQPVDLVHTISLDWARFSLCVVLKLKSAQLEVLIDKFNEQFPNAGVKKNDMHTTVAVLRRV